MEFYGCESALVFLLVGYHLATSLPSDYRHAVQIQSVLNVCIFTLTCFQLTFIITLCFYHTAKGCSLPMLIYFVLSLDLPQSKYLKPREKKENLL